MDLNSLGTVVGILSGLVTLVGAVAGVYNRLQERRHGEHVTPVAIVAGPHPPPASTASGPYPQPTGSMPPPGYRWPATPPPGTGQPGQPPSSVSGPRPGYGAPAGQWGSAPPPPAAYPVARQQPYPRYAPPPARRTWGSRLAPPGSSRWFPYPIVLIGAATFFILGGIYNSATGGSNATVDVSSDPFLVFVSVIVTIAYLGTVIYAAVQAIRLQRWGWLVSILLIIAYGVAAFGIFGPTTRPQPKAPTSYGPYSPYPPR